MRKNQEQSKKNVTVNNRRTINSSVVVQKRKPRNVVVTKIQPAHAKAQKNTTIINKKKTTQHTDSKLGFTQHLPKELALRSTLNSKLHASDSSRVSNVMYTHENLIAPTKLKANKGVMPCTLDYAHALIDPFGFNGDVCVPDLHSTDSFKYRTFSRGTFWCGVDGTGFIAHNPHHALDAEIPATPFNLSDALSNVALCYPIVTSNTSFAGLVLHNTFDSVGGIQSDVNGYNVKNAPYTYDDFVQDPLTLSATAGNKKARLVASGIRIRYIGSTLNLAGTYTVFREPDNNSLFQLAPGGAPGYSFEDILASPTAVRLPMGRKWVNLTWKPMNEAEFEFSGNPLTGLPHSSFMPGLATVTGDGILDLDSSPSWPYCITIEGAAAGAPFDYEVYQHWESVGQVANKTRSHSDINGVSRVRNLVPDVPITIEPKSAARIIMEELMKPEYLDYAMTAAKWALPTALSLL